MKQELIYRSPATGYGDRMLDMDTEYSYYGVTLRTSQTARQARVAEIISQLDALDRPRTIDGVPHEPVPGPVRNLVSGWKDR